MQLLNNNCNCNYYHSLVIQLSSYQNKNYFFMKIKIIFMNN